jgi:hypothetical protein
LGIASLTAAISLGAAAFAVGIAGVIGTIMMVAYVPRYISRKK